MSLLGMRARNHPQQMLPVHGADDGVDDRATHPLHFETFVERFGEFTVDVAAAAHNTKCERYYQGLWTVPDDLLEQLTPHGRTPARSTRVGEWGGD